ncbi:MAG: hypothetical protein Fues2KO_18920 [Fuerstiella sp.]
MSFSGQIYPDNTIGYLRIASATGRQPIEPVAVGTIRIGSGTDCQLRLGDDQLPLVHTVLTVEAEQVLLQCVHADQPAYVNGTARLECQLNDGDLLEIGRHRLLYRSLVAEDRITLDEHSFAVTPEDVHALVDGLERQLEIVDDLTSTPDDAVLQLLQAAQQHASDATSVTASSNTDEDSPALAEPIRQLTEQLTQHHEASRIRLESLTEVINNVVRQQKLIADTLEVMSVRLQHLTDQNERPPRRASA